MSCGFTLPRVAWLKVRISVIVITMVTSTTTVAPKLRASSRRKDEWNNIGAVYLTQRKRQAGNYGLRTQDPGYGGSVALQMRRARDGAAGGLQARKGRALQAGCGRAQGWRCRDQAGQVAASLPPRRPVR